MTELTQEIIFRDIDISVDGWIRCEVVRDATEQFWIKLPYDFRPSPDLVAVLLATIAGRAFQKIAMDIPIGPMLKGHLESHTRAEIKSTEGVDTVRRPGTNTALNFSGGFDSLAARIIAPNSHLVSLDFGGRFSRERDFFDNFSPFSFATNLVDLKLNRYSWEFMGLGSILMRDELDLKHYSFGSILAGSLDRLLDSPLDQNSIGLRAASTLGMSCRNPVSGISEVAALGMVIQDMPLLVQDALKSVALPAEEKFTRKHQMILAFCATAGIPALVEPALETPARRPWGTSFATDLSSLYVMKALGSDFVSDSYREGIPPEVISELPSLELGFLHRVNPHAYAGVEPSTLSTWHRSFTERGMLPYERSDWGHAVRASNLLKATRTRI